MALHADDGPLHWLVRKLLRRGEQAVRLRAAAAAPLAAAWASCPAVASCYLEEFRSLLLDGQTDINEATASDIVPVWRFEPTLLPICLLGSVRRLDDKSSVE